MYEQQPNNVYIKQICCMQAVVDRQHQYIAF